MIRILAFAVALVVMAAPAQAAPVVAVVVAAAQWVGALVAAGGIGAAAVQIVGGLVVNAVSAAIQKKQMRKAMAAQQAQPEIQRGIRTSVTMTGGTNPDSLIVGTCATEGGYNAPWVMHGANQVYMSQIIDLSGVPCTGVTRIFVDGEAVTLGASEETFANVMTGRPAIGRYAGHLWVKFYDGSQTAADPGLLAAGASDPDFPWTADMVGIKRSYVIITALKNAEVWQTQPRFRVEIDGARFYDMRKDSSVGGAGAHRLDNPATWEFTRNPIVAAAHIAMGYALPDGTIYGGRYAQSRIPLGPYAAAANACDQLVDNGAGGSEPAYRVGVEIGFDQEPTGAIDMLLQACDGERIDVGGDLYFHVGPPSLPVAFFTDADTLVSQPEELQPFPSLQETINGISITFPDPGASWESREIKLLDASAKASDRDFDGIQDIALPACPYPLQAQRLGQAWLKDARRFLRHTLHLPGDFAFVRPYQTMAWTSAHNGYSAKLFQVTAQAVNLFSYQSAVSLREVDPADYQPEAYLDFANVNSAITIPPAAQLSQPGAAPRTLTGADGVRRPAIRAFWAPFPGETVVIELRQGAEVLTSMLAPSAAGHVNLADGILPGEDYSVRLRISPRGRATIWAGPFAVTAPNEKLRAGDLVDSLQNEIATAFARTDAALEDATGTIGDLVAQIAGHFGSPLGPVPGQPLVSRVGTAEAAIATESAARASGDSALAGQITTITATLSDNSAAISDLAATRVTESGAVAAVEQVISAQYGDLQALAQATAFAEASVEGITAGYVLRLNGANVLEVVSVDDGTGGAPLTNALFAADYVRVTGIAQFDTAVLGEIAVAQAFINELVVDTLQIRTAAVTQSGVAGSGPVTNNSSDWTTVAQFTLPNLPASGFLQGTLSFRISAGQNNINNYPINAEWRVTVNGDVRGFLARGIFQNPDSARFYGPFTANVVGPGNVTVRFEMRNMGGFGVNSSNLYAQVAMR